MSCARRALILELIENDEATAFVPHSQAGSPMAGMKRFVIEVHDEHAPAFKSAVEEFSNTLGTRLESQHRFDKENALTHAAAAFGALRKSVNEQVKEGNPYYA